jgi:hypothetical protein
VLRRRCRPGADDAIALASLDVDDSARRAELVPAVIRPCHIDANLSRRAPGVSVVHVVAGAKVVLAVVVADTTNLIRIARALHRVVLASARAVGSTARVEDALAGLAGSAREATALAIR